MRRLCLAAIASVALVACGSETPGSARKLVVLAVDGLDPDLTTRLIREDRLPHLTALAGSSRSPESLVRVTATPGAESSSAWASFATGLNPGAHGLFDLVKPDPVSGRPTATSLVTRPSAQWFTGGWFSEGPAYATARAGRPFWHQLGEAQIRVDLLFVPGTFPPEPFRNGQVISGSPLPDFGGSLGAFTWLATDVPASQVGYTRFGGHVVRLAFARNVAHARIAGIRSPVAMDLPLTITWNPEARSANIVIGDTPVYLAEGQESRWLDVSLRLNILTRIDGLVRLRLVKAGNDLQLYVSPVQWHPHRPPSAISSPPGAADALFQRLGAYRTLSWPGVGWALADGRVTDDDAVAALDETFTDRAEALLNRLDSHDWDVIVAGVETIDVLQRLMWRFVDPGHPAHDANRVPKYAGAIERAYLGLDELVGQVRARLPAEAALVVVSAYGVYTARDTVDLNRWLTDQGLLAWRQPPAPVTLAALTDPGAWDDTVDWAKTSARALGYGQIFLNRVGRDPHGTVVNGAATDELMARIRSGLESLTDPLSGRRVVSRVRAGADLYHGSFVHHAPDLRVSFAPGYRMSWDSVLGGMAPSTIARNTEVWSAEHASMDENAVPGVWFSTFPTTATAMSILDIAPTILHFFGQPIPTDIDGTSRLRVGDSPD